MIWVTWRQHRGEAMVIAAALAAVALVLVVTGREIYDSFNQLGVANCLGTTSRFDGNCPTIIESFGNQWGFLRASAPWLNLVPLLVAMLVGAPLVARELEHGTHRLVWTQGVTRLRWLGVKLALVIAGCLAAEAVLIALLTWWEGPFIRLGGGNFGQNVFDLEGTAPVAYMAFALAVAIAAGTLLRRALPAMALTLLLFLGVRLPVDTWLRPHYQAPLTATYDLVVGDEPVRLGDWVIDDSVINSQGKPVDIGTILTICDPLHAAAEKGTIFQCAAAHGFRGRVVYQPADRLATFQAIETGLYLVITAGLLGLTVYWVRWRAS